MRCIQWLFVEAYWLVLGLFGSSRFAGRKIQLAALFDSAAPVKSMIRKKTPMSRQDERLLAKWRAVAESGEQVIVLFLDLSSSVDAIGEDYKSGYHFLLDEVAGRNPYLVIFGFHSEIRLHYEGRAKDAPRYETAQFKTGKSSMLDYGTALFDAVCAGARLAMDLRKLGRTSVFWLTDGLDTASSAALVDAVLACAELRKKRILHEVIGVQNTKYDSSRSLERVLRVLMPPPPGVAADVEQTCHTQVGFTRIRDRILRADEKGGDPPDERIKLPDGDRPRNGDHGGAHDRTEFI